MEKSVVLKNKEERQFHVGQFHSVNKPLLNGVRKGPLSTRPSSALQKHGGSDEVDDVPTCEQFFSQDFNGFARDRPMVPVDPWNYSPSLKFPKYWNY
jgi:hypothetical protein